MSGFTHSPLSLLLLLPLVPGFAGCAGAASSSEPTAPPPPNLLIIQTDEHNFRTLGCYRALLPPEQAEMWGPGAVVDTPHLDRLARDGAICTRFYATSPVCSPSRASFVSGRYPQHTGVVANDLPLADEIVTFAELLRRRGYATGYAGKWHLDGPAKPGWAPARRFGFTDHRFLFNRGHWKKLALGPAGPMVKARNAKGRPTYGVEGADEESFTTDFLAARTVEFIAAHAGEPFCFQVSFPDPHGPDTVRAPYDTMYRERRGTPPRTFAVSAAEAPAWGKPQGRFQDMAPYFGMVKCIDDNVGKILGALEAHGVLDDTIVVFTSDHGDLRGEHHRQNKGVPFEASARIPFLVRAPGRIPPGTVVNATLATVDFLPTILGLLDVPTAGLEDGRDASALLRGGEIPAPWEDVVFLREAGRRGAGWLAAVTPRHKLVVAPGEAPWLFDLTRDPDELVNAFATPSGREAARPLARLLLCYAEDEDDPYLSAPGVRADLRRAAGLAPEPDH